MIPRGALKVLFSSAGTLTHSYNYSSQFTQTIPSVQKTCRNEVAREWRTHCHSLELCKALARRVSIPAEAGLCNTRAQGDRGTGRCLRGNFQTGTSFYDQKCTLEIHRWWISASSLLGLDLRAKQICHLISSFLLLKSNYIWSHWPKQKLGIW